jgi:exodeoxyribonuclease VIII
LEEEEEDTARHRLEHEKLAVFMAHATHREATMITLRYSSLKHALTSARAYREALDTPRVETPAMRLGTAIHCAVLEPERFELDYVVRPSDVDGRTKAGKEWAANAGSRIVLSASDGALIGRVADAVHAHERAAYWLDRVSVVEREEEWPIDWPGYMGYQGGGRPDALLDDGGLLGLKTTRSLATFESQAARMRYTLQWAWYHDGLVALGRRPPVVVEIVAETHAPYDVACFVISDAVLEVGRDEYRHACRVVRLGYETGEWPGAYPGDTLLTLPPWAGVQGHPDDPDEETDYED